MKSTTYSAFSPLSPATVVELFGASSPELMQSLNRVKQMPAEKRLALESVSRSTAVFAEPGARNEQGEYLRWVYVKVMTPRDAALIKYIDASMRYPWPIVSQKIDAEALMAHWHMTKLANWPEVWRGFANDVTYCARNLGGRTVFWALAAYTNAGVPGPLFDPIPTEIIDALNRPD